MCKMYSLPQQEKYQAHISSAQTAVHQFSMRTDKPILQTSSTIAANDTFHYVSYAAGHQITDGCDISGKH